MRVFSLPDLGEGLQEAEIVEWHVKPGDEVSADQAMVSLETDKAIVEVPAPHDGRIEKLFGGAGDVVHVGAPLVGFEGAPADAGTVVGELPQANAAAPAAAPAGPQRGMRRSMARNMAAAHAEVAAVTLLDDADVEHWPEGTPLLARLARALIAAARSEPGLNAWYDAKADARRELREVHLGIAVDLPDGLLVPVLRDAQKHATEELARLIGELVQKARDRALPPALLRGATITLSNFGPIGGRYATPMVVPPAVAIVGAGFMEKRPVVTAQGALAAHRVLPLSLTFDHRAATGGEAGRFLCALIADLER